MESLAFIDHEMIVVFLLFLAGALAGFIDSIVGGGGLISLPAMMLTGLPTTMALGSNKLSGCFGSTTAALNFWHSGLVNKDLMKKLVPFTFIGALLGTILVINIPPLYLKPLIIALLVIVTLFVVFKKDWGEVTTYAGATRKILVLCGLGSMGIAFYDGFIGPGAGTFYIFMFIFAGFNFVNASGNAKVLNVTSNIAALLVFWYVGQVHLIYGLTAAIGQMVGAQMGSRLAIRKGSSLVRVVFISVTSCMIAKLAYDYITTFSAH